MKRCRDCKSLVGPRSTFYCDYHASHNAGYQLERMRRKRRSSKAYREKERRAVKKRMRILRAKRRGAA